MKFLNSQVTTIADTVDVDITDGLILRFRALPITWDIDIKSQLPEPVGDESDPAYKEAVDRHNRYTSILMIIDSLEPGQIEFQAIRKSMSLTEYIEAVNMEMAEAGFNAKHFQKILTALTSLNGYTQAVMDEVEPDFFGQTGT